MGIGKDRHSNRDIVGTYAALKTLDALVLARLGGAAILGQYTVAIQVVMVCGLLPTSFVTVIYPSMSRRYGQNGVALSIFWLSAKTGLGVFLIGLPIFVVGWYALPFIVPIILPNYIAGILAAQWSALVVMAAAFTVVESVFNVLKTAILLSAALLSVAAFVGGPRLSSGKSGNYFRLLRPRSA